MKICRILILICMSFIVRNLSAQPSEQFSRANEAYQNKDYKTAIEIYERLAKAGYRSAALEYNLGNAWYRSGSRGRAILHYERALLLDPQDKDIQYNLALVRQSVPGDIEALPEFFLLRWWEKLRSLLPSDGWTWLGILFWWAGFAGFFLWLKGKTRMRRKQGWIAGWSLILLSILPIILGFSKEKNIKNNPYAIVVTDNANLLSAPDESATVLEVLPEGLKVRIEEKISNWLKAKLPNGESGWLKNDALERL